MRRIKETVYAFIDSNNLHLAIKDLGWSLDFTRFRIYLKEKYHVEQAYLFIGYMVGNETLYTQLQRAGYTVVFKPTLEYKREGKLYTKGNVDAELVLHTMIEYKRYDKAIIVSGDGDFYCLIEYLKNHRKLGRLLIPNRKKYSRLLWKFNRDIDYLNNLKFKLAKK